MSDALSKIGLNGTSYVDRWGSSSDRRAQGIASKVCTKVQENGGEAVKMHCIILQEALCATVWLDDVMNTVEKNLN